MATITGTASAKHPAPQDPPPSFQGPPPSFVVPSTSKVTYATTVSGKLTDVVHADYMDDPGGGGGSACGWAPLENHWMNGGWGLTGGWGWDGEASWCWSATGTIIAFALSAWPWYTGHDEINQFGVYGNVVNVCADFSLPFIGSLGGGCNTSRVYAYPGFVVTDTSSG